MLESPHVLVGAAIARNIPNPLIAIPLSLASHFVLDILPHWNPHINREIKKYGKPTKQSTTIIAADSSLALLSGTFIALSSQTFEQTLLTLACCLVSVLPDVVEAPYYFLNKKHGLVERWIKWQKSIQNDVEMIPGLISQLLVILASIIWLL